MQQTINNPNNLKDEEMDEKVTRVKVYIINSSDEVLVASSNGGVQLPGGHVEENETLVNAIIREVQEETGIVLNIDEIVDPFYEVRHYVKNFKNSGKNKLANTITFWVKSDKLPDVANTNLTENEKKNNYNLQFVKLSDFENLVLDVKNNNKKEINRVIAGEILDSFKCLKTLLNI